MKHMRAIAGYLPVAIAGIVATLVGLFLLVAPESFHASYGIAYGGNVSLLSEVRGMGAVIGGSGVTMLLALLRPHTRGAAQVMATCLFLSIALGRVCSIAMDGWPHSDLVVAGGVEFAIGIACVVSLSFTRQQSLAQ